MRVLHCIWRLALGGAERQLVQLTSGLIAHGVDVHVATAFAGSCDELLAATGATTHRFRPLGKYDLTLVAGSVGLFRRVQPDVVMTWLTQMDIVAGAAAQLTKVPWILCERSAAGSYAPGVIHAVRARLGAHADTIVANSEVGRDYWRRFTADARIRVIPNIVPLAEIAGFSAEVDCGGDDVILYVGRFSAEKNLDRLIKALAVVLPGRHAKVVFCGDGLLRKEIEQKAAALGIADRAVFLGAVPNVWAWMKRAAVVACVGLYEGDPNVALEAIACGTPVVVSDIPAYRALVGPDAAWLADPLCVNSIAAALTAALDRRAEARARAERARAVVAGRSAGDIAMRYIDVCESLIRRSN